MRTWWHHLKWYTCKTTWMLIVWCVAQNFECHVKKKHQQIDSLVLLHTRSSETPLQLFVSTQLLVWSVECIAVWDFSFLWKTYVSYKKSQLNFILLKEENVKTYVSRKGVKIYVWQHFRTNTNRLHFTH